MGNDGHKFATQLGMDLYSLNVYKIEFFKYTLNDVKDLVDIKLLQKKSDIYSNLSMVWESMVCVIESTDREHCEICRLAKAVSYSAAYQLRYTKELTKANCLHPSNVEAVAQVEINQASASLEGDKCAIELIKLCLEEEGCVK